jgi:hypothetical protein
VLRQLKTAPETRHIKVILVSSKSQTRSLLGLKQGAATTRQPYPDETLLAAPEALLMAPDPASAAVRRRRVVRRRSRRRRRRGPICLPRRTRSARSSSSD